jgi:hypothetical protein
VLSTCSEDSGTPRTLSSKQTEMMDGRGVREKERENSRGEDAKKSAILK